MTMRRRALAAALTAAVSLSTVSAVASADVPPTPSGSTELSKINSAEDFGGALKNAFGSSHKTPEMIEQARGSGEAKNSDEWWDNLHWTLKILLGVSSASAIFTGFGILRTLFYNIFSA